MGRCKTGIRKVITVLPVLACMLLCTSAASGATGDKGFVRKGDRAFRKGHFAKALNFYLQAVAANPKDCYANFQAGAIYYLTDSAKMKAVTYFENAVKYTPAAGQDTIIDAYYYLGNCYLLKGEYDSALYAYAKYLPHLMDDSYDAPLLKEIKHNEEICNKAPLLMKRPADSVSMLLCGKYGPVYVTNLGSTINTPYPEYAQVTLNHDSTLIFTSRRPTSQKGKRYYPTGSYYEDIFIAQKNAQGQWSPPTLFSGQIKVRASRLNLASVCVSENGKTLFIFHKGLIFEAHKTAGGWSKLQRVGAHIKSIKKYMPSVFLSFNGKELFTVSDKKGGYGDRDIYVSTDSGGVWSVPKNLGPEINTPYDEDAPFLMPDNKTLFFSSKGHNGLGGYDIFKSVYTNGKWSAPVNLGYPVNSPADDIFFTYDTTTKTGYFSSSRINSGYGDMDIYSLAFTCHGIDSTVVQGKIMSGGKSIAAATITYTNIATQKTVSVISNQSGNYSVHVTPDTKYNLTVKAPNYMPATAVVVALHQCNVYNLYQLITMNYIMADSLKKGQTASFKSAFYYTALPQYKSVKSDTALSAFIHSCDDTLPAGYADTTVTLNYTHSQIDSLNPPVLKVVMNTNAKTGGTHSTAMPAAMPKFPVVLFAFNKTQVAPLYRHRLDSIAKIMHADSKIKLQITGYTDNIGRATYNMRLSRKRAKAVAHYLMIKGVQSAQIHTTGKGINNPAAPNDGTHNYLNRRAELMLIQ